MHRLYSSIRTLVSAAFGLLLMAFVGNAADTRASTMAVPDACTFIPKADLETLIGRELRDGEPQDMPAGFYQCDFETPPQMYVKRHFENPPLPEAAGFSSVTITTYPTSEKSFAESRQLMQTETVPGVGDSAYLEGPAMIRVRVSDRGFSIRLHTNDPTTDAGRKRLFEVMVSLAEAGVARLK